MNRADEKEVAQAAVTLKLKKLDIDQVKRIDEMLDSIGEYGELHLIIQHGELRYINKVESLKAWRTDGNGRRPG